MVRSLKPDPRMEHRRFKELSISRVGIGTVQFGMKYGIHNATGQVSYLQIVKILQIALEHGVNFIDTAPIYGESEELIGKAIKELGAAGRFVVCTKLDIPESVEQASDGEILSVVKTCLSRSLERLGCQAVPLLLLHKPKHRIMRNGLVWDCLKEEASRGTIGHLGVSIGGLDTAEALDCCEDPAVEAMQIPFNALDARWDEAGVFEHARRKRVAIFTRSAYLQGLLLMPVEAVPDPLAEARRFKEVLNRMAADAGLPVKELALRYVFSRGEICSTIIGVDSESQFRENLSLYGKGSLQQHVMEKIRGSFIGVPQKIVVPWLWDKK